MNCLKPPKMGQYGMEYDAVLTDEFRAIVDKAKELIEPLVTKECADYAVSFYIKDEYCYNSDSCDDEKCVKASMKNIREHYGKYKRITKEMSGYGGDHERISTCCVCGKPLNQFLTWNEIELEYLLEVKSDWGKDLFIEESFIIMAILNNTPSIDENPSGYDIHQVSLGNKKPMTEALKRREKFYNDIAILCKRIIRDLGKEVSK